MTQQLNQAVAGAGELSLSAFISGGDINENKWWSTGKADTEFSQVVDGSEKIEVPGTSWDNQGKILAGTTLPGSLKITFTIPMFTPRSMAIALSGALPERKAVAGGPVVDHAFSFSTDWKQRVEGYGEIDLVTTPLVAVDAATGLVDYTDQLVVETGPGIFFIRPVDGATLDDGIELLLDFTELADDGYAIYPNSMEADFRVSLAWVGKNILAGGRKVTHDVPMMTISPTSPINWQAKEPQAATFEGIPIQAPGKDYSSMTHWPGA